MCDGEVKWSALARMCDLLDGGVKISSSWLEIPPVPTTSPLIGTTSCGSKLSETFACVTLRFCGTCVGTTLALPALHKLGGLLACESVP